MEIIFESIWNPKLKAELMAFIQIILNCGQQQTNDVYDEDQLKQRLHELEKVKLEISTLILHFLIFYLV